MFSCNDRRPVPWSPVLRTSWRFGQQPVGCSFVANTHRCVFLTNGTHPEDQFAGATSSAAIRRTWDTLAGLTFSRAVSLTPRPSFSAARMRSTVNGVVLGQPRRLPDDRARSKPAITRFQIIARSNSLNTPCIPNRARPGGVLVSRACWRGYRSMSRDHSSTKVELLGYSRPHSPRQRVQAHDVLAP
jgi:hypothetical protein